ncbi:hypothetical protein DYBT9275_01507 [Dyadobacter sp. CECT 9275]|uniref:NFACT RNA-binding domain-containing protein n=1 Tax=Dyadobacter helix TaxID=2822344 RepID=A0A916J922_9BACT|nr:NFACT RNA binding domain-containing protein [Dyadobacter sp. CECT 9275]CAG4994961.1 hypothetical protein DYBT9275_01507 [Dyadobacter sp. CECT 9275]
MHQNYYFLKQLAPWLQAALAGKTFVEAFSQEKDEIILVFSENHPELSNPFFIKATLRSDFACLSFPDKFDRARRNSVNLFQEFNSLVVSTVRVFQNERAIRIAFENGSCLVLKLFGNRSNLIGFDAPGNITSLFNNKLTADHQLSIHILDRHIDQSFEAYVRSGMRHEILFPTFGKLVSTILKNRLATEDRPAKRWEMIQNLLAELNRAQFYITKIDLIPVLSLLEVGEDAVMYDDPVEALNAFYFAFVRLNGIEKEKAEMIRLLKKRIQQTDHYLENTFSKLLALESAVKNEEIGHIIMANLHQIPARAESVELYDFYREANIRIKLKKDLSPQKNAESYYRKSKNEKIELDRLHDSLRVREQERIKMLEHLSVIEPMESLRELRAYIKNNGLKTSSNISTPVAELFKKIEYLGYIILVGRNAKNNDLLTKQYAFKEDLWLHARDVPGSHVVIKNQPGKKFPTPVIERAAELAAFYSKRKTDSLCPVIVTPKKYVRKLKGMPEGAVLVDKEDVIMVVAKGE